MFGVRWPSQTKRRGSSQGGALECGAGRRWRRSSESYRCLWKTRHSWLPCYSVGRGSESSWWAKRSRQVKTSVSTLAVWQHWHQLKVKWTLRGGVTACDLVSTFSPLRFVDSQLLSVSLKLTSLIKVRAIVTHDAGGSDLQEVPPV